MDFIPAIAVVHELPGIERFFGEAFAVLMPGRRLLLAEPPFHGPEAAFAAMLRMAGESGLRLDSLPENRWSRSAVLAKVRRPIS